MTGGKKWLVVITNEQSDWLAALADKTRLKGSDIIREMIDRIMQEDRKEFEASLVKAQLKIKLQTLNDKKLALAEEEKELKKQYGEKAVA